MLDLRTTRKEKHLGVTLNTSLKLSEQCAMVALKANRILGLTGRNITQNEEGILIPLYKPIQNTVYYTHSNPTVGKPQASKQNKENILHALDKLQASLSVCHPRLTQMAILLNLSQKDTSDDFLQSKIVRINDLLGCGCRQHCL